MDWLQHLYQVNHIWDGVLKALHLPAYDQLADPQMAVMYLLGLGVFYVIGIWVLIWQVWQPLLIAGALFYFTMLSLWVAPSVSSEVRPLQTLGWVYLVAWIASALFLLPEHPAELFVIWLLAAASPWPLMVGGTQPRPRRAR